MIRLKELSDDPALYIDLTESIRLGADILCNTENALVTTNRSGLFCAAGSDDALIRKTLEPHILNHTDVIELVIRDESTEAYLRSLPGFEVEPPVYQAVYPSKKLIDLKEIAHRFQRDPLTIRIPDEADFEKFNSTYHMVTDEYNRGIFHSGQFFGAYRADGEMIGYAGVHLDCGEMGLLHIFEPYRRHGYALELQSFVINYQLGRGAVPYGQIYTDNQASIGMAKALGFEFAKRTLNWVIGFPVRS